MLFTAIALMLLAAAAVAVTSGNSACVTVDDVWLAGGEDFYGG